MCLAGSFTRLIKAADFGNTVAQIRIKDIIDMYAHNTFTVMKIQTTFLISTIFRHKLKIYARQSTKQ